MRMYKCYCCEKEVYMRKRIISLLLLISILLTLCFTVYAAEADTDSLEAEVSDRIEQMVSLYYSDYPGQYEVGNAVAIYNADTVSTYYIIPVFATKNV